MNHFRSIDFSIDRPSILVFVNRGVESKFNKSLVEQMSILNEYKKTHNIVYVTAKKTSSNEEFIREVTGVKFNAIYQTHELYEEIVQSCKYETWVDFYNKEDWFSEIPNLEMCIMFGGQLSTATGFNRVLNKLGYIITTGQQMKYQANGTVMCIAIQMIKSSNVLNIPFNEIVYDTLENSYSQVQSIDTSRVVCYHGYNIPRYNIKRLDSLQHYVLNNINPLDDPRDNEKEYDIVLDILH